MRTGTVVLLVLAMVSVIVVVDVLFLRDHIWLRLATNVGIVLVFAAIYYGVRDRG
jgi:predicted membrane channel-forming protein YqfA (hemolysin III family)